MSATSSDGRDTTRVRRAVQRLSIEALRPLEDRPGDLDAVIGGELAGQLVGCIGAGGELSCQSGTSCRLNLLDEATNDLAEGPDLVLGVGTGNQHIGRMSQRPKTTLGISFGNGLFQLDQ